MADTQQRHEIAVAAGLGDHPVAGIDEDNCKIRRRATRDHVACILFVSRRIGDDELAPVGRKITVGHIDGDALFAFGLQTVAQQGVIDVVAGVAAAFAVPLKSVELIFVEFFTVEKQTPDKRRFAVVDRACGQEAQQILSFVLRQKFFYAECHDVRI